jgi:hypothetical protein
MQLNTKLVIFLYILSFTEISEGFMSLTAHANMSLLYFNLILPHF